ncbi:hypothetical protein PV08_01201 [Exophiala spinifera]|uniref:Uncharacterized protein n=1 Tax=Exophiala spinifera TaxID=91928 RepID=A0A0D1YZA6_9EURO|nr:uncharacterized protein PV08_01201 [Exophiala spinifera]KIW20626.1 hypothetical protein PV08_01201 [Exophiala spinifera]
MSLLVDSNNRPRHTLRALWDVAQMEDASEWEVLSFWRYLLSKHAFEEEYWIVDHGIRYVEQGNENRIAVLLWHEAKRGESMSEQKECEDQALQACQEYLQRHAWQTELYAMTTLRTKAKIWSYDKIAQVLVALYDDHYVEANSSEGIQLKMCFERTKTYASRMAQTCILK